MMLTILVNETPIEIEESTNLYQLLEKMKIPMDGIAIAINNQIISKNSWETKQFKGNDTILIIKATQGG
jgi:sulfur carrier protein